MPMKKQFITAVAIVIVLLATPFAALAQSYSFSLDRENVIVFLNEDNSISLEYTFVFTNDAGAHEIDFVDVGMPGSFFDIEEVSADVNSIPVSVSPEEYQGIGSGFAVVLGTEAIQPGETGTVHVAVQKIMSVLNRDSQDANYASFQFNPTWFSSDFVHGNTDLTVTFHLPPGIQADEPRFHVTSYQWEGTKEPMTGLDESGQITYTWHAENASGHLIYTFGASFPLSYVPVYATELAKPTLPPPTQPARPTTSPQAEEKDTAGLIFAGTIAVIVIGAASYLKYSERRDNRPGYLPPQISIEGYGIKRGLTAVEAAILLEQPLDKVLTMILFGVVKKGVAKITSRAPLQLDIVTDLPKDLHTYEQSFLDAFHTEEPRNREEKLQEMFIDLIKTVSEKMRGFSQDETQRYYRGIVQRAWEQVQGADTPEVKNREFDRSLDWLMLNHRFNENVQELFADPGMTTPPWWNAYDQNFKLPDRWEISRDSYEESAPRNDTKIKVERSISQPRSEPLPEAKSTVPASSGLLGADYAAAIVNSVQEFSSRVISDVDRFTDRVHEVTNLRPVFPPRADSEDFFRPTVRRDEERVGGSSAAADGFFSLFSGSGSDSSSHRTSSSSHRSSSGSRHSSCACACAGCACACAGGGR
jgi:hypothetical protein